MPSPCHKCANRVPVGQWWRYLCKPHKTVYEELKRKKSARRIQNIFAQQRCPRGLHKYKDFSTAKEQCTRCGIFVMNRKLRREMSLEYNKFNVSKGDKANHYFVKLQEYYALAPVLFNDGGTGCKIANIIYYLRYTKGYSAEKILNISGMIDGQLNMFLVRYPAIFRNGKVSALYSRK